MAGQYPNLFGIIGYSIPELLDRIQNGDNDYKFRQVQDVLPIISNIYKTKLNNRPNGVRISWDNPVCQCAYVFVYVVKHTSLVYEALCRNNHHLEAAWRRLREIGVCSIGGGPGSDIAGVIMFLEGATFGVALRCTILDLFPEWENSWNAIARNMTTRLKPVNVRYHRFDLVDPASVTATSSLQCIHDADLVTFVKAVSNVNGEISFCHQVFPTIMNAIKPGGFVLYIDNSAASDQNRFFKQTAVDCGFRVLYEDVSEKTLLLPSSTIMDAFRVVFNYYPMRNCSVTVYVMQKASLCPLYISHNNPLTRRNVISHDRNVPYHTSTYQTTSLQIGVLALTQKTSHFLQSQSNGLQMNNIQSTECRQSVASTFYHTQQVITHSQPPRIPSDKANSNKQGLVNKEPMFRHGQDDMPESCTIEGDEFDRLQSSSSGSSGSDSAGSDCNSTESEASLSSCTTENSSFDHVDDLPSWENLAIAVITIFAALIFF